MHHSHVAVAGAAAALLLGACGSSSSDGSSSPTGDQSSSAPSPSQAAPTATGQAAGHTPCDTATFGAPLAPKDAPGNVHQYSAAPAMQIDTGKLYLATITTAKGVIKLCLEPSLAPATVNNFVVLARNHFYDGLKFHRVVSGFVIQGGDPAGTGQGGPGYQFDDEPVKAAYTSGCVAMANAGPNTNGSQFFICSADDTGQLQPLYNLFGYVSSGSDVVQRVAAGDVMQTVTVAQQQ